MNWKCPLCGAANTDDPKESAVPICARCDKETHWPDIEAASE